MNGILVVCDSTGLGSIMIDVEQLAYSFLMATCRVDIIEIKLAEAFRISVL